MTIRIHSYINILFQFLSVFFLAESPYLYACAVHSFSSSFPHLYQLPWARATTTFEMDSSTAKAR